MFVYLNTKGSFLKRHQEKVFAFASALIAFSTWLLNLDLVSSPFSEWTETIWDKVALSALQGLIFVKWQLLAIGCLLWAGAFWEGRSKENWKLVEFLLSQAHCKAYKDRLDESDLRRNYNQVTLYRYKKFLWPWQVLHHTSKRRLWPYGKCSPFGGWIYPLLRADKNDLNAKSSVFYAPLDDESKVEGVAGNALLFHGSSLRTPATGGLKAVSNQTANTTKAEYAQKTFIDEKHLEVILGKRNGRMMPRSIGAVPVYVNDEIWGALVFDSRSPNGVPENLHDFFSTTVTALQLALEGNL